MARLFACVYLSRSPIRERGVHMDIQQPTIEKPARRVVEYRGPRRDAFDQQVQRITRVLRQDEALLAAKHIFTCAAGAALSFVGPVILASVIHGAAEALE